MPLRFDLITYDILELSIFGGAILANILLVFGGYRLRKNESDMKYADYLFIIGLSILLYSFLDVFLPDVAYYAAEGSDHWEDIRYGFTYDFLRFQGIELAFLMVLGMAFVLIAYSNRTTIVEKYLFTGGIGLFLASFLSLVNWGMYYFLVWLWPQDFLVYYDFFVPWQLFNLLLSIFAFGAFTLYTFQSKQKFLLGYGVLSMVLLCFGLWDFTVTFEVFSSL